MPFITYPLGNKKWVYAVNCHHLMPLVFHHYQLHLDHNITKNSVSPENLMKEIIFILSSSSATTNWDLSYHLRHQTQMSSRGEKLCSGGGALLKCPTSIFWSSSHYQIATVMCNTQEPSPIKPSRLISMVNVYSIFSFYWVRYQLH